MKLDIILSNQEVGELVAARINGITVEPDLITPNELGVSKSAYKRFQNAELKQSFRKALLEGLLQTWNQFASLTEVCDLMRQFVALTATLDNTGAVIFGDLVQNQQFMQLVQAYDHLMETIGSKSWLHSYINLANYP